MEAFNENKLVHFSEGSEASIKDLVFKYFDLRKDDKNKKLLVLARSWRDVVSISAIIRENLAEKALIGKDQVTLDCYVSDKVFKQSFAIGDRVRLSKNDYKMGLTNGQLGRIESISKDICDWIFEIKFDNGIIKLVSTRDYLAEDKYLPMVHAYASTIYSAQGLTVDGDCLVLANSSFDRANAYVAGSRHKDKCHWFFNGQELDAFNGHNGTGKTTSFGERVSILSRFMSVNEDKTLAIEYMIDNKTVPIQEVDHTIQSEI
jgi:ATP-dependent exoDNAse (exonuclease V) alpha subunit